MGTTILLPVLLFVAIPSPPAERRPARESSADSIVNSSRS